MKKIFILLLFNFSVFAQSQNENSNKVFNFATEFSVYGIQTNNFGNNFLAKANKPYLIGIGTQLVLFKVYNFGLGYGGEFVKHQVTNNSLGGNIKNTNATFLNLKLIYYQDLKSKFRIEPLIGIGQATLNQRTGKEKFGKQTGTSFYLGSNLSYKINNNIAFFVGIDYRYTKYKVNTNTDFISFFDNSNQVQLKLGATLF